jgi:hypothetical protein
MGVRAFNAICKVTQQRSSHTSSPDRWEAGDNWHAEAHRKHREGLG